ncbi:putative Alanine aminotransferase [Giardia muris]|uniref:Putative Alanine aminotransferase n=1 Tax=Giardia muris TaxID=5742 RepID=A0A4Z1SQX5_GIAMU|nr:putative Alanine aminotransferase [Giardia muris]|eukprot:TNJ28284.1 putative Alanine aminotransferase [Giardia muris]
MPSSQFSLRTISKSVLETEYAVRGAVPLRALAIDRELDDPELAKKYPFDRIVYCNIGNPMLLGLEYALFLRNYIALVLAPHVLTHSDAEICRIFNCNQNCIDRARAFLAKNPSGLGAYTTTKGFPSVRREVADFLERRDGFPADPEDIYLTDGASLPVKAVIKLLSGPNPFDSAILLPIPQYPLYSATLTLCSVHAVHYELHEEDDWSVRMDELRRRVDEHHATSKSTIRAIVIINPGNPTGSVLTHKALSSLVDFCDEKGLVILSDEVYQANIYAPEPEKDRPVFHSMKKVLREWEKAKGREGPSLFSFHSVSKGVLGECGLRGGFVECCNIPKDVGMELYKVFSLCLCANTVGQLAISVMTNPPDDVGYKKHTQTVFESLERRAQILSRSLGNVPFMTCETVSGAMYAFPRIYLPEYFVTEARKANLPPDSYYCLRLLEDTGVCTVPGSGFLQQSGTFHIRLTTLEDESRFEDFLLKIRNFHFKVWADASEPERTRVEEEIKRRMKK